MKVTKDCGIITMSTEVVGIKFLETGKRPHEACTRLACRLVNYIQDRYLGKIDYVKDYIYLLRDNTSPLSVDMVDNSFGKNLCRAIADGFMVNFGLNPKDAIYTGTVYTGNNMDEVAKIIRKGKEGDILHITVRKYTDRDRQMYLLGMNFGCEMNTMHEKMVLNVVTDDLDFKVNGCCALEVKKKAWGKIMEHLVEHNLHYEGD